MPIFRKTVGVSSVGGSYNQVTEITADGVDQRAVSVAAAKTGVLTVRTDANTGTLTMDAGHGFTTGVIVSLFWTGGSRHGVVVGTVATNSVPIDLGSGDDLPAAATAITAMLPHAEDLVVDGDNVQAYVVYADGPAWVSFYEADGTTLVKATQLTETSAPSRSWDTASGVTNPLAAADVGVVKFSHGSTAAMNLGADVFRN